MQDLDTPTASAVPVYLHLSVTGPETDAALSQAAEGRDRQELALAALKIGILSLKAARGTVDGAVIRHEGERLRAALLVAKALALRGAEPSAEDAAGLAEMDHAIEAIRKQISGFDEIRTSANTIKGGHRILKRARIMEEQIERRLVALGEQVGRLRAGAQAA